MMLVTLAICPHLALWGKLTLELMGLEIQSANRRNSC